MIDTASLRKRIRKMAVTGKLSKQNDYDTPVSKLLQNYVPKQDIELDEIPDTWKYCKFDEVIINRDSERIPVSVADRKKLDKVYDYYGASGVIDKVDKYLFDEDLLLIGEDGANLLSRSTPIAFIARGKYWVNNHAHVLGVTEHIILEFTEIIINSMSLEPFVTGAAQPKLSQGMMNKIALPIAPIEEQQRIVDTVRKVFDALDLIDDLQNQYELDLEVLKDKIIDAGIQGKLTEQLQEDGTAEELLKQIVEEKKQLIKDKKIKASKPLPEITEDEIPFDIPVNWDFVRVGNVCEINPKNDLDDELEVSFIPMACVKEGYTNEHTYEIKKWGEIKKGFAHFANGDVGVAKITPCFQNRKSVVFRELLECYGAGTTELTIVRPIANMICPEYLLWFFKSTYFINRGVESFTGVVGQQRIHKGYLKNCVLPLPPYAEQVRIAEKINSVIDLVGTIQ